LLVIKERSPIGELAHVVFYQRWMGYRNVVLDEEAAAAASGAVGLLIFLTQQRARQYIGRKKGSTELFLCNVLNQLLDLIHTSGISARIRDHRRNGEDYSTSCTGG
jgi:hypothetical protein